MKTFEDNSVSNDWVKSLYEHFKFSHEAIESDKRFGRLSTNRKPKNVEHVQPREN